MSSAGRPRRRGSDASSESRFAGLRKRLARRAEGEEGFLLIEVMVSVMLVGLIAVATFNGFSAANRFTADQRRHSAAQLLAAQSQEQLRSNPATALDALETEPHSYTRTVNGTEFTITQEAKPISASGSATGCTASTSSKENGANILIVSSVTWALLKSAGRPPVKQASVITPPIGSALEVDVTNGAAPPAGVSGVTATAKFVPEGTGTSNTASGTTASAGCVVLSGLATTTATVEIAQKPSFVTMASQLQVPTKEVTIVPNLTTQYPVTYAEAGRVEAEFTYKGSNKFGSETVTGDTFVVSNSHVPSGYPSFAVGGTAFAYKSGGEETYKVVPGTYSATAFTAAGTSYPKGLLFPFPSAWAGYAGDCPKNDVNTEALGPGGTVVTGTIAKVTVPLSRTELNIYKGLEKEATHTLETAGAYEVKITNTECEGYESPLHATASELAHTQKSSKGHLTSQFQPFGKAKLCLSTGTRTYTATYNNATATGSKVSLYIGEQSNEEKAEAREEAEATARTKRISEEKATREANETLEATEDLRFQKLEKEGKISRTTRKNEEKNYENKRLSEEASKRTAAESAETTANNKKQSEETKEITEKSVTVKSAKTC
ncbi:MAG TPA: hypothetical protein VGG08_00325 [Solirubrobacteraceae bacterium]|jgi:Tfp pilus assembly protein PilV